MKDVLIAAVRNFLTNNIETAFWQSAFLKNGIYPWLYISEFVKRFRLKKGDTYTLKVTYTASRDLENDLLVGFVDTEGW